MPVQLNYSYLQTAALVGNIVDSAWADRFSYVNPMLPQVGTLTVGGTAADGNYTVTITPNDGGTPVTITTVRATTPATNALIAADLNTKLNASNALLGVLSSANASAVNTLTFRRSGQAYTITTSAPSGATLVWAQTQAPGGSYAQVGRWARKSTAAGADRLLTPIIDGTTIAQIVGVVERTFSCIDGSFYGQTGEVYPAGYDVPILRGGRIWMVAYEAMTPADTMYIWIDPAATAVPVGGVVKSTDGGGLGASGDAIDGSTKGRILSTAAAGQLVVIEPFFGV
jgi:hypothetical protein